MPAPVPADPAAQLHPLLHPDERLLWSGRPDPAVLLAPVDVLLIPFSALWGGFALFWEISVVATGASWFFVVWGIPFVAVGAYLVVGRFLVKRHRKRVTAYGVSTRRALLTVGSTTHAEVPLAGTPRTVRRHRDGRHVSVSIGHPGLFRMTAFYGNTGLDLAPYSGGPLTFYDVTDGDACLAALTAAEARDGT